MFLFSHPLFLYATVQQPIPDTLHVFIEGTVALPLPGHAGLTRRADGAVR